MSNSSGWFIIGDHAFPDVVSKEIAYRIVDRIQRWKSASYFFVLMAAFLAVWLAIDLITPVLDRMKSNTEKSSA